MQSRKVPQTHDVTFKRRHFTFHTSFIIFIKDISVKENYKKIGKKCEELKRKVNSTGLYNLIPI